jgi:hypothetical protein
MPITLTQTAYTYDELSDAAKETARDWYRQGALDYEWWNFVYDDADQIAKILGIEIDRRGKHTPAIYFSGFWGQGDGACFEGSYSYAKGAHKRIREYAPLDDELHRIADNLLAIQRKHFYQLSARITHTGRYYHEHSTSIHVFHGSDWIDADTAEDLADILRDFMRWIYCRLEAEYDFLMSDEQVEESIRANEYLFDEDGRPL